MLGGWKDTRVKLSLHAMRVCNIAPNHSSSHYSISVTVGAAKVLNIR